MAGTYDSSRFVVQSISSAERGEHVSDAPSPSRGSGTPWSQPSHRAAPRGPHQHTRNLTYDELHPVGLIETPATSSPDGSSPSKDATDEETKDHRFVDEQAPQNGALTRIVWLSLASRAACLLLFMCFDVLIADYDTSPELGIACTGPEYIVPVTWGPGSRGGVPLLSRLLQGLMVWDSVHFVSIAKCGYEFENQGAFFPFVPLAMRILHNTVLLPVAFLLGSIPTLILAALLVSMASFAAAAAVLYRLSLLITASASASATATLLFIFNPASAHFTAAYSEAPFALFSMSGMLFTMRSDSFRDQALAAACFALSCTARSNGILNVGYLAWTCITQLIALRKAPTRAAVVVLRTVALSALALWPFVAFQAFGYFRFCSVEESLRRPWCSWALPYHYGFVQEHYWNNGFLRFWSLRKIGNFIQALPVIVLSLSGVYAWLSFDWTRAATLGLRSPVLWSTLPSSAKVIGPTHLLRLPRRPKVAKLVPETMAYRLFADAPDSQGSQRWSWEGAHLADDANGDAAPLRPAGPPVQAVVPFLDDGMAPFVFHWAFNTVFALLFMHVEVATRFVSTLPAMFWCAASFRKPVMHFTWLFFLGYFLIGALLFPNFYPWT